MKTGIFLMMIVMAVTATAFAQNGGQRDPAAMAKRQSDRMKTELSLTDEQYAKVVAVNEKAAEKMKTLRENGTSRESMREERTKMDKEKDDEFVKILSKEQWDKWVALKEKLREERRGQRGPGGPGSN